MKLGLEVHTGQLPEDHRIMPWLVRHAAWQLCRFTEHHNGKTSYEMLKGKPYRGELVEFGEVVWARDLAPASKMAARWASGVLVGIAELSDEHLIATSSQTKLAHSAVAGAREIQS